MFALKVSLLLIAGITNCLLALLVLARDSRKLNAVSFFLLSFSVGGWAVGIASFLLANDSALALVWAKIYYAFPILISFAIVYFVFSFPSRGLKAIPFFWRVFAPIGMLANLVPLIVAKTYLTRALTYHDWGKQIMLGLPEYSLYSFYLLVCFIGALYVMYKRIRTLEGIYAEQARLFFLGFSIASLFGVTFNLILPGLGNYRLIWLGPLFTTVLAIMMAVSIVRHKMFDVRLAIARAIAYLMSLLVLASIFGFLVFGVAIFVFNLHFAVKVQIFISAATAIAAMSFSTIKSFFDQITNSLFYHDAYDAQSLFDELNRLFVVNTNLEHLLRSSTKVIEENFKAEFCFIGTKATEHSPQRIIGSGERKFNQSEIDFVRQMTPRIKQKVIIVDELEGSYDKLRQVLNRNDVAVLGRLTTTVDLSAEGIGYLVLGPRKSGNPYNASDKRVLEIIVNELVIAIENSLRFEEIRNFNETLKQRVDEATKQLRSTNVKLKSLDETKDDFISMASHQLRTPLTSVKGYLSLVLEGDAGAIKPSQRKLLTQAFTSSQRMVYLIADLLNVSRLKTGKFIIESHPVNLANVVQEEIEQLAETAESRSLTLTYSKPSNFPVLNLDETKVRQVIMNFIDNAIYYTQAGGNIEVKLADNPKSVELQVIDDGMGVPKAEQHHLFTKFYRAANARRARPDGTGLGLFMAQKVVVAQGGAIVFKSKEGKGSTFGFNFPKK